MQFKYFVQLSKFAPFNSPRFIIKCTLCFSKHLFAIQRNQFITLFASLIFFPPDLMFPSQCFILLFFINFEMRGSKEGIKKLAEEFSSKYLRMSINEDDKLELDLGYQWRTKSSPLNLDSEKETKNSSNRLYSDRDPSQYFNLAMLFFSEISTESPLDIDLLDTLFFQADHSICYLYKDSRKGLIKTKQRGINACENFLKRKLKKKENISSKERIARKYKPLSTANDEKSEKSIKQELGYIALLKYKDGTFLRLKESDLRSIFTNPLYANEKFKHNNCTQYIQSLPQEGTDEFRIHYTWQKFKDDPLLKLATNYQLGVCEYGDRPAVRKEILESDQLVYLYYTVFQICSYICIHYNKRVECGTFHFVKQAQSWSLAGIESVKATLLEQKEFMKANLWEETKRVTFGELRENEKEIFKLKEEAKSEFYKKVEGCFSETNNNIKHDMVHFVKRKIDNVKRSSDKLLSRTIFQILHPDQKGTNLYDLLDSPQHLAQMITRSSQAARKAPLRAEREDEYSEKSSKRRVLLPQRHSKRPILSKFIYRGIETLQPSFQEFQE